MTRQSILLVSNTDWSILNFWSEHAKRLIGKGYGVSCLCWDRKLGFTERLRGIEGLTVHSTAQFHKGIAPHVDARILWEYYQKYRKLKPTIVHHFTIKPIVYGTIAARLARVPLVINTIQGMGYMFTEGGGLGRKFMRLIGTELYRFSCGLGDYLTLGNRDDHQSFLDHKMIKPDLCEVIPDGGIDTQAFRPDLVSSDELQRLREELKVLQGQVIVFTAARLLYDKGITELIRAARAIRETHPGVRFLLAGALDPGNPAAISEKAVHGWVQEGAIEYLGLRGDMKALLAMADIFVLPSYREGAPKSCMEAMCMEKPVVTTLTNGCRDAVDEGVNGFLVPVRDDAALARALLRLVDDPGLRERMGRASREKVERDFDQRIILERFENIYQDLLKAKVLRIKQ